MSARSVPLKLLRDQCQLLADAVRQAGLATPEQLRAWQPGGGENPATGAEGWLRTFALLHRAHAKLSHKTSPEAAAADEMAVLGALAGREEVVRLLTPVEGVEQVAVHPKSFDALLRINAVDHLLEEMVAKRAVLLRSTLPEDQALRARVDDELRHQLCRLVAWITHPKPGLPDDPTPAPWILALDVLDLHRLIRAHQVVNGLRLRALAGLTTPSTEPGGTKRPSFAVFLAAVASEQGIPPHQMLRDWSLAEVLTGARLAGQARKDAHEAAQARREAA